jgi:hypothetical protein
MANDMKDSLSTTREKARVISLGPMVVNTLASGKQGSKMEREPI